MTTQTAETARKSLLASLGLNSDGDELAPAAPVIDPLPAQPVSAAAPTPQPPTPSTPSTDPADRTTPVQSIVFAPLGDVDLTSFETRKALVQQLFDRYRAPGRNPERNKPLWSRCQQFVESQRRERATGGHVREAVKTTAEQRDIAALLAAKGLTAADLARLLDQL